MARFKHGGLQAAWNLDHKGGMLQSAIPCGFQAGHPKRSREFAGIPDRCARTIVVGSLPGSRGALRRMEESPGPIEQDAG